MNKTHTVTLKIMPNADFASFGQSVVAYVRKRDVDGHAVFSIHGADGAPLGQEDTEFMAMQTAQQMNLFPVVVQ